MTADAPELLFVTRSEFRIWLVFGKSKVVITLSANDALEEALCYRK